MLNILVLEMDFFVYIGGVAMALGATLLFNYGPLLQKVGLRQMDVIRVGNLLKSIQSMFKNRSWLSGLLLTVVGSILYLFALNVAGITVVEPLLNFGLIVLVFSATRMLGERINMSGKVAIALLICMPVLIAYGNISAVQPLTDPIVLVIFSLGCLAIIGGFTAAALRIPIFWGPATGVSFGISSIYAQWFITTFFSDISATGDILHAFGGSLFPFCLMLVGNALASFPFQQVGLQKNPAARFNPIAGTCEIITSIIGGILIFQQ